MPGGDRRLIVSVCFYMYRAEEKKKKRRRRRRNSMPARQTHSSSRYSTIERISIVISPLPCARFLFSFKANRRFLTKRALGGRMPDRPLLLSVLHCSLQPRHLTVNYLPRYAHGANIFSFSSSSSPVLARTRIYSRSRLSIGSPLDRLNKSAGDDANQ